MRCATASWSRFRPRPFTGSAPTRPIPRPCARSSSSRGGRPSHPVIVHIDERRFLRRWVREMPPKAEQLAEAFWPGPMTLVLPRGEAVHDIVTGGQDSIAMRIPSHPMARQLLNAFGGGIAAPSANRFGRLSATRAEHVQDEFGDAVKVVLDGGECQVGLESTIVSCLDGDVRLLRPGAVTLGQLRKVVGEVQIGADRSAPRVPGSMAAHYAPHHAHGHRAGRRARRAGRIAFGRRAAHRRALAATATEDLRIRDLDQQRQARRGLRPRPVFKPAHARQGRLCAHPGAGSPGRRALGCDTRSPGPCRRWRCRAAGDGAAFATGVLP